jgi:AcrR family transcriptional regulator
MAETKQRARSDEAKLIKKYMLLDSARILFSENGYQGTSVEMITEKTGVSTGTFYLYFKNKLEVYRTLNLMAIEKLEVLFTDALQKAGSDPRARIVAIAETYYHFYIEYHEYYDIMAIIHLGQKEFFRSFEMVSDLEEQTLALLRIMETVIKDGVARGDFAVKDTWKATAFLWGMIDGVMLLDERENTTMMNIELHDMVTAAVDITLRGMAK